jgi:hypothetical protein
MALAQRHKRYIAAVTITVVLVAAIAATWVAMILSHQSLRPSLSIVLSAALAGAGVLACIPWWRALDEMQREAQLTSWYWGGCFGCVVGILSAAFVGGVHSPLLSGALLVGAAQIVSFALCWVVYWLMHRRAAS